MDIKSKELNYYGIISGICKKIGLVEEIDKLTKSDPQKKVSVGQSILALILNGMGLTMSKPLYLVSEFFKNKPIDLLIGEGIEASDLNDDTLGRSLSTLAKIGPNKIFSHIALNAAKKYDIARNHLHGDTTNMQVYGDYHEDGNLIAFGYPKQGRSDLKQYILSLIATFDGSIPLFMGAIRGNTSDTKHFKELIELVEENIKDTKEDVYFSLDSAAYCEENLKVLNNAFLVTRVPERIAAAKEAKESFVNSLDKLEGNDNYKFAEICSVYANVKQRWVIVYSSQAHKREIKTIEALVKKEKEMLDRELKKLSKKNFSCKTDAEAVVADLAKSYKFHEIRIANFVDKELASASGRPSKISLKNSYIRLILESHKRTEYIEKQIKLGSMFVLATTQLDKEKFDSEAVLKEYKGQSLVENRFNIVKNATCISSKVYLKNEDRITALAMVMCLCLLVYALAERQLRTSLVKQNKTVPHQTTKPIKNPTMKWVFQMFEGIGLVSVKISAQTVQKVTNITDVLSDILGHLGPECMNMYCIVT